MQRCTSSVHCDSFMMTTVFCDCISRSISSAVVMPGITVSLSSWLAMCNPPRAPAAMKAGDAGNLFYGDAGGLQFLIYIMYRGVEACISLCHDSHFLAGVMQGKGGGIHLVVGVEGIGPLLAHGQGEAADTVGGYVEPEHDVGGA